ncbi:unnamed protein product [Ectocarpus sp. CCAP 1310/34]|nr:unnamed protein product [Ectocarpus sp. CCAP 1310/34]
MAESNTTLFLIPGGLTPKLQPCDGLVNKIFKATMSRLYDDHMATRRPLRGACLSTGRKTRPGKKLNSNAQGEPLDAPSAGADKADSSSGGGNLLEVLDIDDDDDTGVVVVDISDDEGEEP